MYATMPEHCYSGWAPLRYQVLLTAWSVVTLNGVVVFWAMRGVRLAGENEVIDGDRLEGGAGESSEMMRWGK